MLELSICIGSSCHLKGSYNVVQEFQQLIEEHALHGRIDLKATFCMRQCQKKGVAVSIDGEAFDVAPEAARTFFAETVMPRIE